MAHSVSHKRVIPPAKYIEAPGVNTMEALNTRLLAAEKDTKQLAQSLTHLGLHYTDQAQVSWLIDCVTQFGTGM